ncbi:roadblock/LC7 domain-containing protein [Dactylosporangium sucinum]|uniref:Dynein regulation protein LC7 n=1 Tax=Dactylosporangium sucinum TaxID=1424081 RepID=A0A917WRS1_9ACTN|nr:roadblock/LC7 domain-containing protein [Dactylosporangium sucinum]GGM23935.1 dynein regulation protein LC7 [Dactylosporangium sucinum]
MTEPTKKLTWLLDDLVGRVGDVDHAVVLSADGLVITHSTGLGRDEADQLAAITSGLHGLANGLSAQTQGGELRLAVLELREAYFLSTAAGEGAYVAVLAGRAADIGVVAYELARLVTGARPFLSAAPRPFITAL